MVFVLSSFLVQYTSRYLEFWSCFFPPSALGFLKAAYLENNTNFRLIVASTSYLSSPDKIVMHREVQILSHSHKNHPIKRDKNRNKKRRMAGLTRRDGMQYNYQLNSFHPPIFTPLLSTFFADEYVTRYVVKATSLQTIYEKMKIYRGERYKKKIKKILCFFITELEMESSLASCQTQR